MRDRKPGGDRRSGKTFGPNLVRHALTCEHCKGAFNAARHDALYCRESCRTAAARERKRERVLAAQLAEIDRQRAADNRAVEQLRGKLPK